MPKRSAIALLITVFFIIAISVSLGISLKQVKDASNEVENETFMLQSSLILEDVSNILKNSQELDAVMQDNSIDGFFLFLSEVAFIPFESNGIKVSIEIESARSKFNVNSLLDTNSTNPIKAQAMSSYLSNFAINDDYVAILLDNMSQIKVDSSYNSTIFNENPYLFRDYIVSQKHLDEINNFYMQNTHENAITKVDFENLLYFSKSKNYFVDLNYATKETWRLLLGCDELRAQELALGGGAYIKEEDLLLSDAEKEMLKRFETSFYEPYLDVKIAISKNEQKAFIRFEYDMKTKKGSNFVYEI
jgi:hypothetical protein